ncbi:MAG: hypothetical protein HQ477_09245 [Chloroflexi bacterium]|nr:hypothetical protein [Chloroflexota bacterium]
MLRRFLLIAVASFSIIAVACSVGGGEIKPADSYVSLSAALESAGMKVGEQVENNFLFAGLFSVAGVELTASGQAILAFEFASPEEASEQAALVSPDGFGIGLKYINWINTPQFFLNGRMIVVYDGSQSLVTDTLTAAMGEQFAGEAPGGA